MKDGTHGRFCDLEARGEDLFHSKPEAVSEARAKTRDLGEPHEPKQCSHCSDWYVRLVQPA